MNVVPLPPRDANSTPNATFVRDLRSGLHLLADGIRNGPGCGWITYICNTLSDYEYHLKDIIQARLDTIGPKDNGRRNTFDDWADKHGNFTYVEVQAARKAWMLDMIAEFS